MLPVGGYHLVTGLPAGPLLGNHSNYIYTRAGRCTTRVRNRPLPPHRLLSLSLGSRSHPPPSPPARHCHPPRTDPVKLRFVLEALKTMVVRGRTTALAATV